MFSAIYLFDQLFLNTGCTIIPIPGADANLVVCALEAAYGEHILRTCDGLKFLGSQIDSDDHALNPSSAQVNFIVPIASALRKLKPTKLDVSQPRKPRVFHDVLDNMNTGPTVCYNLQFDGKLLKQGLTQHGGDMDCLGKEDAPTLQEQQCMHQVHMEQLDHISHILDQAYMQCTLTCSIPSPMVPPLREALLKFHALSKISDTFPPHVLRICSSYAASRAHTTRLASAPGIGMIVHPVLRKS